MKAKTPAVVEERRRAVRVTVDIEACYGTVGTPPGFKGRVTELSTSGLRLGTLQELPIGTVFEITFSLADVGGRSPMTVRVLAVRVALDKAPTTEYGCMVLDGDEVQDALRRATLEIALSTLPDSLRF